MSKQILYVDDEVANLIVFEEWFGCDYTLTTYPHPTAALEQVVKGGVAVVVTDQRMPGMFGTELLAKVAKASPTTIGIIVTAYDDAPIIRKALNDRLALSYILKPYRQSEMRAVLDAALEAHALAIARQDLEERLIKNEPVTTIGNLASSLLHDLQQPLASISSQLVDLVPEVEANGSELARELVAEIVLARDAIKLFVEGTLAQIKNRPRQGGGDVGAALVHAVSLVKGAITAKAGYLELEGIPPPGAVFMPLDTYELTRIVVNLLANAKQAIEKGSGQRITLAVTATDGAIDVVVRDTGPGMSPELLARLGERNFTTKAEGTGIGIYTARRVLAEVGGSLSFESTVGVGTAVRIHLPRIARDA